jgi:hypothetical protein
MHLAVVELDRISREQKGTSMREPWENQHNTEFVAVNK